MQPPLLLLFLYFNIFLYIFLFFKYKIYFYTFIIENTKAPGVWEVNPIAQWSYQAPDGCEI